MIKVSRLVLAALFLLLFSGMSFGQEMGAGESGPGTGGIGGSSASMNIDPSIFGSSSSTDGSKCSETISIGSADALKKFASRVNGGETSLCGKLTADINLDGNEANQWTPIGTNAKEFVGTFDGQGHTIKGLYVDNVNMDYVGLFGNVAGNGVVKNVGVMDSHIKGWAHVGGVVGNNVSGSVSNVYNTGFVNGKWDVGGVVGYNGGIVSNVYNTGAVSGTNEVGGVVGGNNGTVSNAYYNTDFYAGNAVGGGDASGENVEGKTTLELASKTLPDGFDENVWVAGSISIGDDGSVTFGLPYLNGQSSQLTFKLEMDVNKYLEISTALQLKLFAQLVNSGETSINGKLTADICLNACKEGDKPLLEQIAGLGENGDISTLGFNQWTPMNVKRGVQVTFDGNGRTISGLYFNNENDNCVGLFGEVTGALSISDLGIKDSYFKGKSYVGGLVGENYEGTLTVTNSYNAGTVSGVFGYVGGLVGDNGGELTITNSYNAGTESGRYYVGGLVGFSSGILTVTNSYNAGAVSGSGDDDGDDVGGVVGYNNKGTVSNVYNTGSVRGTGIHVGGVVGYNDGGTVSNVYNTGSVSGYDDVGGVVGDNYGTVSNVYNTGSVSGDSKVGGVVGLNDGTVSNGFFNTEVTCENCDVVEGATGMSSAKFADGTVAMLLHDWCEMDGETCKEGGLNGSIWGQDLAAENSLPDFSGVVGFKYGSITFFNLNDDVADSASIDATAKAPVSITSDIVVTGPITFKRPFAVGYSTMMLPFSVNAENKPAELKFYSFDKVEENNGKYTASYNPVNASSGLNAHTPYIVKNSGKDALSQVTFEGEFTLGASVMPPPNSSSSAWKFNGTYEYKTWEEGDAGLGRTYGFAGSTGNDPDIVGKFAKVGAGAYIYPMRAYLEYTAPAALARPAANGEIRTVASLPDEIDVVIVDKDEKTGEQTTKVIGTINTRTGEFKFANDRWFDLQGRYLGSKKPTQKGAYYNNGKKVIVK